MNWTRYNRWGWLLLCSWAHLGWAQPAASTGENRAQIERARIAYLTEKIDLSVAQAQQFWPLYNEFAERRRDILRQMRLLQRVANNELSEAEAEAQLRRWLDLRMQEVALSTQYTDRFLEVLSAQQVRHLYAAERAFSAEVLRQMRSRPAGAPARRAPPRE